MLSLLTESEIETFLKECTVRTHRKGSKLDISKSSRLYYIVENGSARIFVDGGPSSCILCENSTFGYLPFVDLHDEISLSFLEDTTLYSISDDLLLRFFLSDFRLYRAYIHFVSQGDFPLSDKAKDALKVPGKVVSVHGSAKSGITHAAILGAIGFSSEQRVLLVSLSNHSKKSIFQGLQSDTPQSMIDEDGVRDIKESLVAYNDSLDLCNFVGDNNIQLDDAVFKAFLVQVVNLYDVVVIDSGKYNWNRIVVGNSDILFVLSKNLNDYGVQCELCDRMIYEGQRVMHLQNGYWDKGEHKEGTSRKILPVIDLAVHDGFDKNIQENPHIIMLVQACADRAFGWFHSRSQEAILYLPVFLERESESVYTPFFAFLVAVYSFYFTEREDLLHELQELFKHERQLLWYKLVFPEENLFSFSYIHSYFKNIFKTKRLEDLPVRLIVPLKNSEGRVIHRTTGYIAELLTAAVVFSPFFPVYRNSDGSLSASGGYQANYCMRFPYCSFSSIKCIKSYIPGALKPESFIAKVLDFVGSLSPEWETDFLIDQNELKNKSILDVIAILLS